MNMNIHVGALGTHGPDPNGTPGPLMHHSSTNPRTPHYLFLFDHTNEELPCTYTYINVQLQTQEQVTVRHQTKRRWS